MAEGQPQVAPVELVEELARREQQLEAMRQAYLELRNRAEVNNRDSVIKTINSLPTFTGTGEITVNSFFSNIEYLLSTINNEELRKEAVRTIFYRTIQGPAKDAIINVPEPDNWQLIKETLKLRFRPSVEPHHLYKKVANLKVNTVSELMLDIQDIKYKSDELIVYYRGDHYIDLSNMDSLLINTIKEMTQGVLLDKIYNEGNLNNILKIMTSRRFEDGCIRPEYRKFRPKEDRSANVWNSRYQDKGRFNNAYADNRNRNQNIGNRFNNSPQERQWNRNPYYQNEIKYNNSGQYRQNNNFNNGRINNFNQFANSGNFQRPQTGNPKQGSGQYRQNPFRQGQVEPMEIDNIQSKMSRLQMVGHPDSQISQNRLISDRQNQEETQANYNKREEVNNCNFFTKRPWNGYPK